MFKSTILIVCVALILVGGIGYSHQSDDAKAKQIAYLAALDYRIMQLEAVVNGGELKANSLALSGDQPLIVFLDSDQIARLTINLDTTESPGIFFVDEYGQTRLAAGLILGGSSMVTLTDPDGPSVTLINRVEGEQSVVVTDGDKTWRRTAQKEFKD